MSCRGRPVHAQIRCFTSTWLVVSASPSLKLGRRLVTGVSHVSFPSSTSLASSSVVSAFVFDAIMKSVSASTFAGLPSLRTPKPPAKTTLPSWTMPSDDAGDAELLLRRLDEPAELRDPRRVERVRLLARERLARVALRQEPAEDQRHLRAALLADRLRHVVDHHGPEAVRERALSADVPLLVRRRLVVVGLLLRPAVLVGPVVRDLQRPLALRLVRGPGRGDRGVGVLGRDVHERDGALALRRLEDRRRAAHGHGPAGGRDERVAGDRRLGVSAARRCGAPCVAADEVAAIADGPMASAPRSATSRKMSATVRFMWKPYRRSMASCRGELAVAGPRRIGRCSGGIDRNQAEGNPAGRRNAFDGRGPVRPRPDRPRLSLPRVSRARLTQPPH